VLDPETERLTVAPMRDDDDTDQRTRVK